MPEAVSITTLPHIGEPLQGGTYAGVICTPFGDRSAVVLLDDKPATDLNWQAAKAWAEGLGNGAQLPNRQAGVLLFQTLRDRFDKRWHWLADAFEDDRAFAWSQGFGDGYQYDNLTSYVARVRAVRLIPLSA